MNLSKRFPDTITIVLWIMLIFIVLTWIIPAGEFEREVKTDVYGKEREFVVKDSYESVESEPQGLWAFLLAPIKGFAAASQIIGFCIIVGGAFGVINHTGSIDAGLNKVIKLSMNKPQYKKLIIPGVMILFSLAGASFGMSESVLVFIMITVPLALAMGYDSIVGICLSFLAAGAGFAGAFSNPFTIGIAQGIADIPLFSGWEYRIFIWAVLTTIAIAFTMRYARKIEKNKKLSPVYEIDKKRDLSKFKSEENQKFTLKRKIILILLLIAFVFLVIGANKWGWYINEISGLFLGLAIVVAVFYRLSSREATKAFLSGAKDMIVASLVIGLSRGLLIIATEGKIIDTILYAISSGTEGLPRVVSAQLMFVFQGFLNFFVPSGSGQAALTMPIMAPLSDLVGISRQTAVLAFQLGDGIFNMIIPTSGVTMGVLSIAGIPYQKWIKWLYPLIIIMFIASLLILIPPVLYLNF